MNCTKPNCNCVELEEKRVGHPVKSYPCLATNNNSEQLKSKYSEIEAIKRKLDFLTQQQEQSGQEISPERRNRRLIKEQKLINKK